MIIKFSQLPKLRKSFRNKKIVLAGGVFDLLHWSHIELFKYLRKIGDIVVVAVVSDKRVRERKGPKRPILSQKERLVLVDSIRYIDYTVLTPAFFRNKLPPTLKVIAALKPDIFVTIDKRWLRFRKEVEKSGTRFKKISRQGHINSTTNIINKIIKRYCEK